MSALGIIRSSSQTNYVCSSVLMLPCMHLQDGLVFSTVTPIHISVDAPNEGKLLALKAIDLWIRVCSRTVTLAALQFIH